MADLIILGETVELSSDLRVIFGYALDNEANALSSQNTMSIWLHCILDLYGEESPDFAIEYSSIDDIWRQIRGGCTIPLQTFTRGFKSFNQFLVDEDGKIPEESLLLKVDVSQRDTIAAFFKGVRDYCYSQVI